MADLPTTTILVGLAVALARAIEWLAKAVLQKRNGTNGNGNKSGARSVEEWEGRMRKLHEESEEHIMSDMRNLMEARTLTLVEKVTNPIVAELRGLRNDLAHRDR